jgi:hypothetical protein
MDGTVIRHSSLVLLCEDTQQESFVRRWLKHLGWDHRMIRVNRAPGPRGSAEQYVRIHFPGEVQRLGKNSKVGLVTVIDADTKTVDNRLKELSTECDRVGLYASYMDTNQPVAILVPRRNIETWIHYLDGNSVNENEIYPKLGRQRTCDSAVRVLASRCTTAKNVLSDDAPESLKRGCNEIRSRIVPLRKR